MIETAELLFSSLSSALLNGLWISAVLIGIAWASIRVVERFRPVNASTRYGIWTAALAASLAAHIVVGALVLVPELSPDAVPTLPTVQGLSELPAPLPDVDPFEETATLSPVVDQSLEAAGPREAAAEPLALGRLWSVLGGGLLLIWLIGASRGMSRLGAAYLNVRAIKLASRPLDRSVLSEAFDGDFSRDIAVRESTEIDSPVAAGLDRPDILLPAGLAGQLSSDELRQVILHEAAHLERFDDITVLLQRVGEALLWHHPLMRFVGARMQQEREIACDDWVISRTRSPEAYVRSIGRLIELNLGTGSMMTAPGLADRPDRLIDRMRRVLNERIPSTSRLSGEQVAVAAGLLTLVLVLVVAFSPLMRFAFSFGSESGGRVLAAEQVQDALPIHPLRAPAVPEPDAPPVPVLADEFADLSDAPEPPVSAGVAELVDLPADPAISRIRSVGVAGSRIIKQTSLADRVSPTSVDDLSVRSWLRVLDSIEKLQSQSSKTRVLATAIDRMPDSDRVFAAMVETIESVPSNSSRAELLVRLVDRTTLDDQRVRIVRKAAAGMPSSSARERVIRSLLSATR